jgi:hypothetical protein
MGTGSSGGTNDPDRIFLVQLSDFMWQETPTFEERMTTARTFRVFPGEGVHSEPLAGLVLQLERIGYRGDYSFEVFNDDDQQLPLDVDQPGQGGTRVAQPGSATAYAFPAAAVSPRDLTAHRVLAQVKRPPGRKCCRPQDERVGTGIVGQQLRLASFSEAGKPRVGDFDRRVQIGHLQAGLGGLPLGPGQGPYVRGQFLQGLAVLPMLPQGVGDGDRIERQGTS